MKKVIILAILIFIGMAGWRIGNNLSSDAVSMAVGIFFGVLAGIPTALLVLASERHRADGGSRSRTFAQGGGAQADAVQHGAYGYQQTHRSGYGSPHQPPVIILNGGGQPTPQQLRGHGNQYLPDSHGMMMPDWQPNQWAMAEQPQRPGRRFRVVGEQEEWLE